MTGLSLSDDDRIADGILCVLPVKDTNFPSKAKSECKGTKEGRLC